MVSPLIALPYVLGVFPETGEWNEAPGSWREDRRKDLQSACLDQSRLIRAHALATKYSRPGKEPLQGLQEQCPG